MKKLINDKEVNMYTTRAINEVAQTMQAVLRMFPQVSYKYGFLIPVIALLVDGKYTVGNTVYSLSADDRAYLESLVFYRDQDNHIQCMVMYPDFDSLGSSINIGRKMATDDRELGYDVRIGYIKSKRYITMRFMINGGSITYVNMHTIQPNMNEFIDKVCNCMGISQSERTEFVQILASTRMIMNAA